MRSDQWSFLISVVSIVVMSIVLDGALKHEQTAYARGYEAAVDSVRAHEEWGYVLMRGNQRLKLTPGIVDSLWLCPEALGDVTAIAIGRGRR